MRLPLLLLVAVLSCLTPSFAYEKLTPNVPVQNIVIPPTQSVFYEIDVTNHPSTDSQIYFLLNVQLSYATFIVSINGTDYHSSKLDAKNSMLTLNLTSSNLLQNFTVAILNTDAANLAQVSFVATTSRTIQLTQNIPQFVQLHLPDITDFYFTYQWQGNASSKDSFYCLISDEINANYSIYATFDGSLPSPSNWQWNSTSYDVDEWRDGVFWTPENPAANALIQILVHLEADNYNTHAPILVEALRISPSDPITLALFDGQESPMLHMRGETMIRMTFNATQVNSHNLFLSIVKETGSLVVYVLSPDDMSVQWPSAEHYTAMLELDWAHANSTTLQTNSAGIWRIVAINTLLMHPSSSTLFSAVVSSFETPISIPASEPVAGVCTSSNVKAFYSLVVPDVSHDTTIYIRPTDGQSYSYQGGVSVIINTAPRINPNTSIIGVFPMAWDHTIWFGAHNGDLVTCDRNAAKNGEPCVLYIQVGCSNLTGIDFPVNFVISVQRHGDVMPIDVNDELPQIKLSSSEAAHFSIAVSDNDRPVHVAAYPCSGRAYLYASLQSRYPSNSSNSAFKSQNPYAVNQFTIPQELLKPNGTTLFLSVKAVDYASKFILRTMSYDPSQDSPLVAPRSLSVQASSATDVAGRLIARWMPPALSPSVDPNGHYDILYDIYSEDYAEAPGVYWTRCGFGHVMPTSVYQSGLSLSPDGYFELPIDDLDTMQLSVINVFATFVNRTSGRNETWYDHELIYTASTGTASPGPTPAPHSDSSDGAEIAEILAAVFLPLFLLAGAVAYYFHRRNKRLQEELSMSLPDIENLDTMVTPASDRRQRGARVNQPMNGRRSQQSDRYSLLDNDSLSGL